MKLESTSKPQRVGAPRWMVTFADLMALLFALFVLLLSFSEIDSDAFRKNAGPMAEAFNVLQDTQAQTSISLRLDQQVDEETAEQAYKREMSRTRFRNHLEEVMKKELAQSKVELESSENEFTIRFPSRSAFASGRRDLAGDIVPVIDRIAGVLAQTKGRIFVSGHTDNSPISTAQFRSNWDLSAARAVSVVHQLLRHEGIDTDRVTAQGFADSRPLAPNDTPENRAINRRVEVSIEIAEEWD